MVRYILSYEGVVTQTIYVWAEQEEFEHLDLLDSEKVIKEVVYEEIIK